ncbi:hypothetical protein Ade02nite_64870 [Paractinoplanes deccanensis]|uniref:DUF4231 domain-containing protein n=1 Tax=Paractinoplanes deccanensis TaxID=113561 RepID=A0ABQ3YCZ4_9ACTN|nr:DUF6232 family protein [Actinoplanes deccanensis]GID77846.1 hypothetical protein Ade02nite_64870 [Actinoplanes deccanensis]
MSKRTYYRGPDAVVTDEYFIWRTTPVRSYSVRDLRNVGQLRAVAESSSPVRVSVAAAVTVGVIGAGWTVLEPPHAYAIGLVAVTVPVACTLPSMFRRNRAWELRARYRGVDVVLYSCTEERQFNQVKRALRRAMEDARPSAGDLRFAAA